MAAPFLYSTNPYIKFAIQRDYQNDVHFVWCSEVFDSTKVSVYCGGAARAVSSDPADIYRRLKEDVRTRDRHSDKIQQQRAGFVARASDWFRDGNISEFDRDDIVFWANHAEIEEFHPLLYVISRPLVEARLVRVPAVDRAGYWREYKIPDLRRSEFDIIEL